MTGNSQVAKVVQYMLQLRDARAELKKRYEDEDRKLRERYGKGEAFLLQHLNSSGVDKFSVDAGTVYTTSRLKASIGDRNAFGAFVAESGEVDLLDYRVNTTALKDYMEQHEGAVPPGVTTHTERTLNIRRG